MPSSISPNPPKTSPLWAVGPIIIINLENLSMISITKVVISNEILNSPNCGVEGSHSPNEQDLRHNEDGFRAKYSRKITADFL